MNELQRLLLRNAAFTPPPNIVREIPEPARTARPNGLPHSIAEELAHIVYWQDLFLQWAKLEPLAYPAHAADGWRIFETISQAEWDRLVERYLQGLLAASEIAGKKDLALEKTSLNEPGSDAGCLNVLEVIVNLAVHNGYHLGRIVQLRQMLGCWPPPEGGDTW